MKKEPQIKTAEELQKEMEDFCASKGMGASDAIWQDSEPIHLFFSLSYAQYLTIPRTVLQSMPREWQERFVKCLVELDHAIDWRPEDFTYWVKLKRESDGRLISAEHDPLCDYERGRRQLPVKYKEQTC